MKRSGAEGSAAHQRGGRRRRWARRVGIGLAALVVVACAGVGAVNWGMAQAAAKRTVGVERAAELAAERPFDAVIVLGAGIYPSGRPTPMLASRLDRAAELYRAGAAPVVLATGDNSTADYNELATMHRYAVAAGVPAGDVYLDYAGFSTYESMYRARHVFGAKRILVVTQAYHLPRALHDAAALGLDAWGVAASAHQGGQLKRDLREFAARVKDWGYGLVKPEPTFLGPAVELAPGGAPALIERPANA